MPATTSRLGRISTWMGRLGIVAALLGPTLAHFEIVRPLGGVLCLAFGLLALLLGPGPTRPASAAGLIPAVLLILAIFVAAGAGENYPRINDITTDARNPPVFVHAITLPENAGRDMAYPAEFAAQQQSGYPDLAAATLAAPPDEAFKQVAATARSMDGWNITREDAAAHVIEGYDTTRLFRFKDDFIIEVRPLDGKSQVQMRSKSRDGKGDMGANANRIRVFFARLGN